MSGLSDANRWIIQADPTLTEKGKYAGLDPVGAVSLGISATDLDRLMNAAREQGRAAGYHQGHQDARDAIDAARSGLRGDPQ